jgi:hypothetical protein
MGRHPQQVADERLVPGREVVERRDVTARDNQGVER